MLLIYAILNYLEAGGTGALGGKLDAVGSGKIVPLIVIIFVLHELFEVTVSVLINAPILSVA